MDETNAPIIERAEPLDAAAIRDIAVQANIDAWSENDYRTEIQRTDSFVLKAVVGEEICGFLLARTVPGRSDIPDLDLYNVAVQPERIRVGIGSALMSELLDRLDPSNVENIWLEVRESNITAIRFYEKHGFLAELTRPRFYADPVENAVIMRLKLNRLREINSG